MPLTGLPSPASTTSDLSAKPRIDRQRSFADKFQPLASAREDLCLCPSLTLPCWHEIMRSVPFAQFHAREAAGIDEMGGDLP